MSARGFPASGGGVARRPDRLLTLTDAAAALRAGDVTSVDLTHAAIARADRLDAAVGVYLTRLDEAALERAALADTELARGQDRGPLHGIPLGVKDIVAVAEAPTTAQSLVHDRRWHAGRDAPVVARLKDAGAVITGKTTTMEFACGTPDAAKPFPLPRNPWDLDRWAGGSSSGTASGVATGMFAAGIGTDTVGSIRLPAAFCGVSGLMPTYGAVPKSGCIPVAGSLDRIGPLAHSARDCAAVLAAIAGRHPSDPSAVGGRFVAPEPTDDLTGVRIGVMRGQPVMDHGDPAVVPAFEAAIAALADRGALVDEVELPYWAQTVTATFVTVASEALAYHRNDLVARWDDYFRSTRGLLVLGAQVTGADYVQAQRVRRLAQDELARLFTTVDVIASPTALGGAPPLALLADDDGAVDYIAAAAAIRTPYWDGVGHPALAVPMGFNADGLPLSLQLAGAPFAEATIVRVGDVFQQRTDWHLRVPALVNGAAP